VVALCRDDTAGKPRTTRSLAAEAAFRARLTELGAILLEERWLGNQKPHRMRCAAGHECNPRPACVQQGQGICRTCAGNDSKASWEAFRVRVEELGGTVLEPAWLGTMKPHRVRCAAGHECNPRPHSLRNGQGICRACAGKDPKAAEVAFRARVEELGGVVLEPEWLGKDKPHRVRCAAGHDCSPRPQGVRQGQGICRTCAGQDSELAWAAFRARVKEQGGIVLEPAWLGNHKPHRGRCAAGHECSPWPSSVQQGQGICRKCTGKAWDAFYVVVDEVNGYLKFGITSGGPRRRLGAHARDGFDTVLRLATGLPGDTAHEL
jgi:hypothetical protein